MGLASIVVGSQSSAADTPALVAPAMPVSASGLTVLSYNVEGLPWPIARGRADAAAAIGSTLRTMRSQGVQPKVVALQEAFGKAAKSIGRNAGYAYYAFGPSRALRGGLPTSSRDQSFVAAASLWHGERLGKHFDSGLAIFSDYPILWAKRVSFPAYACAGWDCMANKGVLAVAVQMPGSDKPVIIFDTHLNSQEAARVDRARTNYAYRRQIDALGAFISNDAGPDDRVLIAGDFNVGHNRVRAAYIDEHLMTASRLELAAIEYDCGLACRKVGGADSGTVTTLRRAKSLILFRSGAEATMSPAGRAVGFGQTSDGQMLSDHVGLETSFRLDPVKSTHSEAR
jgi:endonuclease/exonuclease/phosphatase family metal-dependent hydrolase